MIKFFRKIRQNLLSEGKTGKYLKYAVGEILLVVIGILIALQINNWNQDRIYNKERIYLISELLTEFENNLDHINEVISRNKNLVARSDTLIEEISKLNFPGDEQILSELLSKARVINIATSNLSTGMMNSITNTSNFQHINDKSLRRNLLNWSGYVDDMKENEIIAFQNSVVTMRDYLSRFTVFGNIEMQRDVKMKGAVVTNPLELRNKLFNNRDLKWNFISESKQLAIKMEEIIELLKQELNNQ